MSEMDMSTVRIMKTGSVRTTSRYGLRKTATAVKMLQPNGGVIPPSAAWVVMMVGLLLFGGVESVVR